MSYQSESRMSDRSSTCRTYEEQQNSDTEEDMYAYASPIPIAYEVPGSLSHTPPEMPERTIRPPPPHNLRMKNSDDDSYSKPLTKLYTTLTHAHVPSIYSTPSHSVEFRLNAAVIESSLDLVNLQRDSSTPLDEEKDVPRRSHSRVKMTILVFLLVAVAIGTISLVVSIVAVFVKRDTSSGDLESVSIEEMVALREEVVELQTAIEQVTNQTSGYVDFSAFYDSCITETKEESCNPELVPGVEFPCRTDTLPLNKTVLLAVLIHASSSKIELCRMYSTARAQHISETAGTIDTLK